MNRLVIMSGVPGVGKSALVDNILKGMVDPYIYSTDDVLEKLAADGNTTYDGVYESMFDRARKTADAGLRKALQQNKDVIWDQTNLTPKKRKSIMDRFPMSYVREAVAIRPPVKSADYVVFDERLDNRKGKTIPAEVVANMIKTYTDPKMDEGFDYITIYNFGDI